MGAAMWLSLPGGYWQKGEIDVGHFVDLDISQA